MLKNDSIVAVFPAHAAADSAVRNPQRAGFDMTKLSILGRDYHTDEHVVGFYNTGDRMKVWGKTGAFRGGLWGFLVGPAFFWNSGAGPILVAGPFVAAIVGALGGGAIGGGLSAIGAGLFGPVIPQDSIVNYETARRTGKFVLLRHGPAEQAARAKDILRLTAPDVLDHRA